MISSSDVVTAERVAAAVGAAFAFAQDDIAGRAGLCFDATSDDMETAERVAAAVLAAMLGGDAAAAVAAVRGLRLVAVTATPYGGDSVSVNPQVAASNPVVAPWVGSTLVQGASAFLWSGFPPLLHAPSTAIPGEISLGALSGLPRGETVTTARMTFSFAATPQHPPVTIVADYAGPGLSNDLPGWPLCALGAVNRACNFMGATLVAIGLQLGAPEQPIALPSPSAAPAAQPTFH